MAALEKRNLVSYPIHLKLETGMNRLGFRDEELDELLEVLTRKPHILIRSVFSHLGASDRSEYDQFTRRQIDSFRRMSDKVIEHLPETPLRHILNSSGIERFPEAEFDMVRLGIGLYGINTVPGLDLQTVSSLKSIISQIKPVHKGESVGYGRSFIAGKDMTIGVVPVGYGDGLRRDLGVQGASFYVNGVEAPVLGNLCMDMCMVDLTGIQVKEGDMVEIFGRRKPVTELAERLGTIPYEILAGLSQRVKRVYFQE
jgi:alanine racemase